KLEFADSDVNLKPRNCDKCRAQAKRYRENNKLLKIDNEIPNEILEPNNLADYIYDIIELHTKLITAENNKENNQLGIHFLCAVDISSYNESPKEIADNLINIVSDVDEYSWIYNNKYVGKQATSIWYFCSQRMNMAKKPRKHNDPEKRRDTTMMERYDCMVALNVEVPEDIKQYIKDNIDLLPREIYANLINRDMDTLIVQKQVYFDNTNNLGFELYVLHAEVNGSGYPIAYLFLESDGKSGNGVRTEMILTFLNEIKLQ
ncbi:3981_t:CDS:2, partial [Gigaspora margarita]